MLPSDVVAGAMQGLMVVRRPLWQCTLRMFGERLGFGYASEGSWEVVGALLVQSSIGRVVGGTVPHASYQSIKLLVILQHPLSLGFSFSSFIFKSPLGKDRVNLVE